jgi:hypothetical protein
MGATRGDETLDLVIARQTPFATLLLAQRFIREHWLRSTTPRATESITCYDDMATQLGMQCEQGALQRIAHILGEMPAVINLKGCGRTVGLSARTRSSGHERSC